MNWKAKWITCNEVTGDVCPVFMKEFDVKKEVASATLIMTASGVYEALLNDTRIGDFIMAPGWTSYRHRLQYQTYDITSYLQSSNKLSITAGKGWYHGRVGWDTEEERLKKKISVLGILVQAEICYTDGTKDILMSDESWSCSESSIRFSELYDGETQDASFHPELFFSASVFDGPFHTLIPQEGEIVKEQDVLQASRIITTPNGETVIDFGQEITGYVEVTVRSNAGEVIELSHAEILDKDGNFYTKNYRTAKAKLQFTCCEGTHAYKPKFTFFGFRYIRLDQFPGGTAFASLSNFKAIAVHSSLKRTGTLLSSNPMLNQLFHNIIWGQKGNFLDIPTDCPQRDERLGWTGDAQTFIRTAALNYDVEKFFIKWLADLRTDQTLEGAVPHVIPNILSNDSSAAWGDAAVICPWEIYMAYGNPEILSVQFESMKKWIDYITLVTKDSYLWTGTSHFGDWLGLDAPIGSYKGSSREDFIATAFYAYSSSLLIKAGHVLKKDMSGYETLYKNIKSKFQETFSEYLTQTEFVLAIHFSLAPDCKKAAAQLAEKILADGAMLKTGFVGTPYLLHVLSDYGYQELAYTLLLRTEYPSWLYPVTKGATTIWEHWDGIMENGDLWSSDMNSFNHYSYGAVADWIYGVAAGITTDEDHPGYQEIRITPHPDKRLDWLKASFESRHGLIRSEWRKFEGQWCYEIETPVKTVIQIGEKRHEVEKGTYIFFDEMD